MRRTPLRRQSKKHAARAASCRDLRKALVAEVGHCEMCGHDPLRVKPGGIRWQLACHEIGNGANRQKCLDKRYALLVLCWLCNSEKATDKAEWPEARQLAALKRSRPEDYNLLAYNGIVGRGLNRITQEEVDSWQK